MNNIQISEDVLEFFLNKIDERIDAKLKGVACDKQSYARVDSVNNSDDGLSTLSASLYVFESGISISAKNNTGELLNVGDVVRVTSINGNLANSYIALKCG